MMCGRGAADAPVIMCRGYEHYGKLSMMTKVLCHIHANPSSRVSWHPANELLHSPASARNITVNEKVCHCAFQFPTFVKFYFYDAIVLLSVM